MTGITGSNPGAVSSSAPNDSNLHLYEVGGWIGITAFTSGSVQMQVTYYDPTNTQRTATFTGWLASAAAQSFNAAGQYTLYSMSLLCKANTAITINLVFSGSLTYQRRGMDQQGELSMPHTFHVVALPHTQTAKAHCGCAYTQKVLNFCKMMHQRGHTVYHYGAEGSLPQCAEHVTTISLEEQRLLYGDKDFRTQMYDVKWDPAVSYWALANARATAEIKKRCKPTDFLCLIGGSCQKMVADELAPQQLLVVEFGIGYSGTFAPFCVYESYAHAANRAGTQDPNGKFTDAVIPNYYDAADFPAGSQDGDYFLYVGALCSARASRLRSTPATRSARGC